METKTTNNFQTKSNLNVNSNDYYFETVSPQKKISFKVFHCLFINSIYKQKNQITPKFNHCCFSSKNQQSFNPSIYSSYKSVLTEAHHNKINKKQELVQSLTNSNLHQQHLLKHQSNRSNSFKYQRYLNQYITPEKTKLKKQILTETIRKTKTKNQVKPPSYFLKPKPKQKEKQFQHLNLTSSPNSRFQYINDVKSR